MIDLFFPHSVSRPTSITYRKLPWGHDQSDLLLQFIPAFDFIDRALHQGKSKVLIHCQCGVSRSATAVIGYVMRQNKEGGMNKAYDFVKSKSACAGPNMALIYQLFEYEKQLGGGAKEGGEEEWRFPDSEDEEDELGFPTANRRPPSPSLPSALPPPRSLSLPSKTKPKPKMKLKSFQASLPDLKAEQSDDPDEGQEILNRAQAPVPLLLPAPGTRRSFRNRNESVSSVCTTYTTSSSSRHSSLSPLPSHVTAPPPTPFEPVPSRRQRKSSSSSSSVSSSVGAGRGYGYGYGYDYPDTKAAATTMICTPTAAAFKTKSAAVHHLLSANIGQGSWRQAEADEGAGKRRENKRTFSKDLDGLIRNVVFGARGG